MKEALMGRLHLPDGRAKRLLRRLEHSLVHELRLFQHDVGGVPEHRDEFEAERETRYRAAIGYEYLGGGYTDVGCVVVLEEDHVLALDAEEREARGDGYVAEDRPQLDV